MKCKQSPNSLEEANKLQYIVIPSVMNSQGVLDLSVRIQLEKVKKFTWPPATTGAKALVSQPFTLN